MMTYLPAIFALGAFVVGFAATAPLAFVGGTAFALAGLVGGDR